MAEDTVLETEAVKPTLFSKQVQLLAVLSSILARCQGLEPQFTGPEPVVLPLDELRLFLLFLAFFFFFLRPAFCDLR